MTAFVIPFRRTRILPAEWTQAELGEFYRVEAALIAAGLPVVTECGVSDEGDPWFVFCHHDDQEAVVIHFARISGDYVVCAPSLGQVRSSGNFRQLVRDLLGKLSTVAERRTDDTRRDGKVVLHPSALLWVVVAMAIFKSTEARAVEARSAAGVASNATTSVETNDVLDQIWTLVSHAIQPLAGAVLAVVGLSFHSMSEPAHAALPWLDGSALPEAHTAADSHGGYAAPLAAPANLNHDQLHFTEQSQLASAPLPWLHHDVPVYTASVAAPPAMELLHPEPAFMARDPEPSDGFAQHALAAAEAGTSAHPAEVQVTVLPPTLQSLLQHAFQISDAAFSSDVANAKQTLDNLTASGDTAPSHAAHAHETEAAQHASPAPALVSAATASPDGAVSDLPGHPASSVTADGATASQQGTGQGTAASTPVALSDTQQSADQSQQGTTTAPAQDHAAATSSTVAIAQPSSSSSAASTASLATTAEPITQAPAANPASTVSATSDVAKVAAASAAVHTFLELSPTAHVLTTGTTIVVFDQLAVDTDLLHVQSLSFDFHDGSQISLIGLPEQLSHALAGHL